jgi:hypothetical protein
LGLDLGVPGVRDDAAETAVAGAFLLHGRPKIRMLVRPR